MEEQSDKNTQVVLEERRVLFWLVKGIALVMLLSLWKIPSKNKPYSFPHKGMFSTKRVYWTKLHIKGWISLEQA